MAAARNKSAENALVAATTGELARHAPFDALDPELLAWLAGELDLAYYAAGEAIVSPESGVVDRLRIIKRGSVRGAAGAQEQPGDVLLGPGECFPVDALNARRATSYAYRAEKDTFCWELPAAGFHSLVTRSERFRQFCLDQLSALLEHSHRARRAEAACAFEDTARMLAPLRSVIARAPVWCSPETPVDNVVRAMHAERVGSMVIVDGGSVPVGIFTMPDVLERVTLAQPGMDTPIARLMTGDPVSLEAEAPLVEAAVAMARHGIRHVIVTRDGKLAGVVSERDLFALQRLSLRRSTERIHAAASVPALAQAADDTRKLARHLLAQDVGAEHVTQVISALNDALTQRLLQVAGKNALLRAVGVRWCWLALGSEGRLEQTLATDQDNAVIFATRGDTENARRALLEFANEVNLGLEACGFPLCKGDIMARNPRWCLALDEWKEVFAGWVRNPGPQALLNATIFFDFRALGGDASLAGDLRETVLSLTRGNASFGRAMAENALSSRPPLGLLGTLVADDSPAFPGSLDLKVRGARIFVDAARVWSLANALPATGTAARLRASGVAGVLPADEAAASLEAFHFLQELRLRRQYLAADVPAGTANRIDPDALNEVDRRILKAALRQAALLQDRLRLDFAL